MKTYLNPFAAGQTNQIADVVGGGNASSQNSLIAEFGLQDASSVDSVQVKWPSGQVSNLTNQSIDQLLTITEPSPFSSSGGDHAVLMPRVTAGAAMIAYALPARNVRVSIFDVSGRVVRVIDYDRGPNGAQEVTWNWIDHRGRAVPAGVYLYRIEGGGQREFGRLLRVK